MASRTSASSSISARRLRTSGACIGAEIVSRRGRSASDCDEPDDVAWPGGRQRDPRDQPLEVVHRLQEVAQLRAFRGSERVVLDGVQPILNRRQRDERAHQPLTQLPSAHRRHGAIERVEQRAGASALDPFDGVEVPQRHGIDRHRVRRDADREAADVRDLPALGLLQVGDDGAGRAGGGIQAVETEARQRRRAELAAQRVVRARRLERPAVDDA